MTKITGDMEFVNYLRELSINQSKRDEDIRLNGIDLLLKHIFDDIKAVKGHGHIKFVFESMKIPRRTLDSWKGGNSPIPLWSLFELLGIWKVISNKTSKDVDDKLEDFFKNTSYFSVSRGKKAKLPKKISNEFAYLLGYLLGDGCLKDYKKAILNKRGAPVYIIAFASDNMEFAGTLVNLFNNVFESNIGIYKQKTAKCFELLTSNKVIYFFLNKICEIPLGKKKGKMVIPSIIWNASETIQRNFVAGFFDADGHFYVKRKEIGIAQADKRFLIDLSTFINNLGIKTRNIHTQNKEWGTVYSLMVSWHSTKEFLEQIPFIKPNNVEKAKEIYVKNFMKKEF